MTVDVTVDATADATADATVDVTVVQAQGWRGARAEGLWLVVGGWMRGLNELYECRVLKSFNHPFCSSVALSHGSERITAD